MSEYERIDVVVPIYKGQHYIGGIISQIENCTSRISGNIEVGLILVNDAPDDSFRENYQSKAIDILMIETDQNSGIHGARVRGLSQCKGDYVVFLDQDDKIFLDYFRSQLEALGDADAVICQAINGGRKFYDHDRRFERLTSEEYMFSEGNGILSPGQVLIRRKAIPSFWCDNILQYNGADDWMLWLCMLQAGSYFVRNQDVLYEHILSHGNYSRSTFGMFQSERNMCGILECHGYLDRERLEQLKQAVHHGIDVRLKELDRLKGMADLYDMWLAVHTGKRTIGTFLKSVGYQKIAIYGMSKIGLRLYQEIKSDVEVECFVDRNAAFLEANIPVYTLEEAAVLQADLMVISLIDREKRIYKDISSLLSIPVKGIEDILLDIFAEE